ncbi:hypothetical protein CEXT_653481 [Caerostris extrusa]|uniref:Uncharacterized protein n=1 Tax=Caerostris extrusa TaxID=172846 RepID=A0AAV4WKT7_CAEEX|nr:hypothetical protein CEXT_653481 [Caerostris extrusa]
MICEFKKQSVGVWIYDSHSELPDLTKQQYQTWSGEELFAFLLKAASKRLRTPHLTLSSPVIQKSQQVYRFTPK